MRFNPFTSSRMPSFGSVNQSEKSRLSDCVEDVAFEEVKESASKQPQIDERARAAQISKAAEERASSFLPKDPLYGLFAVALFVHGADWADRHPRSSYESKNAWLAAQHDEVQSVLTKFRAAKEKDFLFEALVFAMFADGALWANDNPAPTL